MRPNAANVAQIAARQYGRVTCAQLLAAGLDRSQIKRWVADGRLRREHTGVYALGHPDGSPLGTAMSAVLAAGSGAVLSHASAGRLLRIVTWAAGPPEVTIGADQGRRRPGIRIHRSRLEPGDVGVLRGVPITTVARVLVDLAPRLEPAELTRACHEAWVRHGVAPDDVERCIARNPRKPGIAKLRRALGGDVTLSALEDGFLRLVADHGLPAPRTNVDVAGDKVDCHWPERDLTVELVSFRFHATRRAFEADVARRRRSSHLAFTYGDVFERGAATAALLRRRLAN